jgi:hypothetical protein
VICFFVLFAGTVRVVGGIHVCAEDRAARKGVGDLLAERRVGFVQVTSAAADKSTQVNYKAQAHNILVSFISGLGLFL